jgi:DNA-binding transcriptional MocR family regulator
VRRLVDQRGISATTAVAALRAVEHRGFAEARPQSGYFAKPPRIAIEEPVATRPLAGARTVGIDSVMIQVIDASQDPSFAPLGAAIPDPELFPMRRLQRTVAMVARRNPRSLGDYGLSYVGIESFRHQLLRRYADLGCSLKPDEILVTNGCTEALNLALRAVTRPGDTVAIESPVYYCILQVLQTLGLKALEIGCHPREGMRVAALAEALAGRRGRGVKACLVSANFSNPTGASMSDAHKRSLVELCHARRVPLVEDDIYGDLQHAGPRPLPAKAFDRHGGVILCSSFSKTLAPGARVGWLCGGRFSESLRLAKFASSGASPVLLQEVLAEILRSGGYERHLTKLRATYARYVAAVARAVSRHFPAGTRLTQPQGGFVIWVELPRGVDSLSLFDRAIRQGVNFAPGPLFSATGCYRNFLRLNCGRWTADTESAIARLGRLTASVCP